MAGMTRALGGRSGAGADLRAMTRPDSSHRAEPVHHVIRDRRDFGRGDG